MIRPTPEAVAAADRPDADVPRDVTDWVLPRVLAGQAARRPDSLWIETTSGERASFAQAFDEVERVAAEQQLTTIFVTHNVREAARLGDRIVLLSSRPGRVAAEFGVPVERPRRIESPEVSSVAADVTVRLREEVRRHAG